MAKTILKNILKNETVFCAALLLAILSAFLAAPSHAACTEEEANQKAFALMQAMQELSQKDPEKYEKLRKEFDQEMRQLEAQGKGDDMQAYAHSPARRCSASSSASSV